MDAMTVCRLDPASAEALRAAPVTYRSDQPTGGQPGDGGTGFHRFAATRVLARRDFDEAVRELFGWQLQSRAGLRVAASEPVAEVGTVVSMSLGVGPLALRIPCRVVGVVDEPGRRGFAYATLPGHPECGEEWFVLEQTPDGRVRLTVSAVSRPATLLARVGGPVSRAVQQWMTRRYLRVLDAPAPR